MTEFNKHYRCLSCGGINLAMNSSKGEFSCCEKPMIPINENTQEASLEKHIPIVKKTDKGVLVIVGDVEHPMDDDHYIMWIKVVDGNNTYIKYLNPGDKPQAEFETSGGDIKVLAYCNLHGLWKSE